jgi:hypothetical protein
MHCHIPLKGISTHPGSHRWRNYTFCTKRTAQPCFSGVLKDQAALYGVLLKIRSLSLSLLALEISETSYEDH